MSPLPTTLPSASSASTSIKQAPPVAPPPPLHQVMRDPVCLVPCGHQLERASASCILAQGSYKATCPTCRASVREFVAAMAFRDVILQSVMTSCPYVPDGCDATRMPMEDIERHLDKQCQKRRCVYVCLALCVSCDPVCVWKPRVACDGQGDSVDDGG
jgi:hypothetical protein